MGLIGISPPAIVQPRDLRVASWGAANGAENAAGKRPQGRTAIPSRPPTELVTACAENCLRTADAVAASRIAQRFAPPVQAARPSGHRANAPALTPASFAKLASGMRRLTFLLILATLLPNLTAAAFWLGLIAPPWSKPAPQTSESAPPVVQLAVPSPVLSTPAALRAQGGESISFPIALDGTDGVPAGSAIVVKGLPQGARLSNGASEGETWKLRPGEIGDLYLTVAGDAAGDAALSLQLVEPSGRVVADAATVLSVATASPREIAGETGPGDVPAAVQEAAGLAGATVETSALLAAMPADSETTSALPEAVPVDVEVPPLPDKRPARPASDSQSAAWVSPSAYVNLRQAPSSSASVLGVVAKGTKLRVAARKRGWVQVSNPATSQTGWIYSDYVVAVR